MLYKYARDQILEYWDSHLSSSNTRTFKDYSRQASDAIKVGDRVKAYFLGVRSQTYPGVVHAINADGTFDIKFNDGDRDTAVNLRDVYSTHSAPNLH